MMGDCSEAEEFESSQDIEAEKSARVTFDEMEKPSV